MNEASAALSWLPAADEAEAVLEDAGLAVAAGASGTTEIPCALTLTVAGLCQPRSQ